MAGGRCALLPAANDTFGLSMLELGELHKE